MPQLTAEPDPDADEQKPPAITAREITMRGPFGPVYGPVDLDIAEGGVTALVAPSVRAAPRCCSRWPGG